MRKLMWLLSALTLWTSTPAVRAQFGQPSNPRFGGPNPPGMVDGLERFGRPQVGGPGSNDQFGRSFVPGLPGGRQPWMPPTGRDLVAPLLREMISPPGSGMGGRALHGMREQSQDGKGLYSAPGLPPGTAAPKIDPKMIENFQPPRITIPPLDFGPKPTAFDLDKRALRPAVAGDRGAPAWLRWEYVVGFLVVVTLAGLLSELFGRKANACEP